MVARKVQRQNGLTAGFDSTYTAFTTGFHSFQFFMPQTLTKQDLQTAIERVELGMTANTREIISHFSQSQGSQNERFDLRFNTIDARFVSIEKRLDAVDAKLEAVMEILVTRKELHILIRTLKSHGIPIEESEIFTV